jgi:HD-GYP domain-containing protein (c-di-GMP phosphodiesterase class II)
VWPGEDIPLGSRILNVADSVDAMTSRRSYRTRITLRDAVEEVLRNNGTQFAPLVVDAFLEIIRLSQVTVALAG